MEWHVMYTHLSHPYTSPWHDMFLSPLFYLSLYQVGLQLIYLHDKIMACVLAAMFQRDI